MPKSKHKLTRNLNCILGFILLASSARAGLMLTLNVYQVCADDHTQCASTGPAGDEFFAAATNKIWAQAGISVLYDFKGQIFNSNWLDIDDSVAGKKFSDIAASTGNFQSSSVVDMFLVHTLNSNAAYGEGWFGAG